MCTIPIGDKQNCDPATFHRFLRGCGKAIQTERDFVRLTYDRDHEQTPPCSLQRSVKRLHVLLMTNETNESGPLESQLMNDAGSYSYTFAVFPLSTGKRISRSISHDTQVFCKRTSDGGLKFGDMCCRVPTPAFFESRITGRPLSR